MKPNNLIGSFLLLLFAITATSCEKEVGSNLLNTSLAIPSNLVGSWTYQSGEEEYNFYGTNTFDTTFVPEHPKVKNLHFRDNGIAIVEERSEAEIWPPIYDEISYTWNISTNGTNLQMIDRHGKINTWQILILTDHMLKVKIQYNINYPSGNGIETITNTYAKINH